MFLLISVIVLLLALVAGSVTNIDIFSHAMHLSMSQAMAELGLDVKLLSTLRSIAVVGFLLMSRMKEVSFKTFTQQDNDTNEQEHTSHPESNSPVSPISQVPPTVPPLAVPDKHVGVALPALLKGTVMILMLNLIGLCWLQNQEPIPPLLAVYVR